MDQLLEKSRAILHLDMDAFYTQVEHVRLGIPFDVPLAVQQWQGLIAVNYSARERGVKRHSTVEEALLLCPELILVHVATYAHGETEPAYHTQGISYQTHKVSLDFYRKASSQIFKIVQRFCPIFQRASIDEAYLDVTELVNEKIRINMSHGEEESWLTQKVDWEETETFLIQMNNDCSSKGLMDLQLYNAASICSSIRKAIWEELGYTCSAGIAHNKTLAKLVSSMNKPNKQSALCDSQVLSFMKVLPLTKIRGLGGKLGDEVESLFQVSKAGDIWCYSLQVLQEKLGEASGFWLYNICRGICHEEVTETKLIKSMAACKSFRPGLNEPEQIRHWLDILASELYSRIWNEFDVNKRWPKTICLSVKTKNAYRSRSGSAPQRHLLNSPEQIASKAWSLYKIDKEDYPCFRMELSVSHLVKIETDQGRLSKWLIKREDFHVQENSSNDKMTRCPECLQFISLDPKSQMEHLDWHFAKSLSEKDTVAAPSKKHSSGNFMEETITFGSITVPHRKNGNSKFQFPLQFPLEESNCVYDPTSPPVNLTTHSIVFGSLSENPSSVDEPPSQKTWASLLKKTTSSHEPMQSESQQISQNSLEKEDPNISSRSNDKQSASLTTFSPKFNSVPIQPRGLINTGNMCFMNSILQPLVHCPPFYNYFYGISKDLRVKIEKMPLVKAMVALMDDFKIVPLEALSLEIEDPPLTPEHVFDALYHMKRFDTKKGRQEDAEEFLGFLLDGLEQELLAMIHLPMSNGEDSDHQGDWMEIVGPKKKTATTRKTIRKDSPISLLFGGSMRSVVKTAGAKDSITIQPFQSLQLDITPDSVHTILDALHHLAEPEYIHGFTSKASSSPAEATKQTLIESLPPILILHLKRFVYEPGTNTTLKLCKFVSYDNTLEISSDMLSIVGKKYMTLYRLTGVVYHHGKMSNGGHYTCHVQLANQEWIQMDDTSLTRVTQEEVLKDKMDRQVYMLFYTQKNP